MEHASTSATIRQQQQQQQHQQLQQHHQEQQEQHEHQQQFCLRWHNHQTSLLSTLPILLDQSHLTDVTISAEGRTLRAHRVVLSACSTFFLELFRTLDTTNHPVIIIPGASFAAIVALLTFMYSGEVNVYEEQIPVLLNLAETLGIKGLADVQNNLQKSGKRQTDFVEHLHKDEPEAPATPPTPPPITSSLPQPAQLAVNPTTSSLNPLLANKLPTPLESFFLKSLQFYPNLLPQPLNFSQTALNKTTELLAKYQQQCGLYQGAFGMAAKEMLPSLNNEENARLINDDYNAKRLYTGEKKQQQHVIQNLHHQQQQHTQHSQQQQQKDIKRIDKIVESLRCGSKTPGSDNTPALTTQQQPTHLQPHLPQLSIKTSTCNYISSSSAHSPHLPTKPPIYPAASGISQLSQQHQQHHHAAFLASEEHAKLQQHIDQYASCSRVDATNNSSRCTPDSVCIKSETNSLSNSEKLPTTPTTPASPQSKTPSNSKLYATCFICHKQLSNQYNLRVHLETHQNVRYACNVCSHVSRSKDALRKHVSYRHPGAPSPCETEARRKRASKTLNTSLATTAATTTTATVASTTITSGSGAGTPTSPTITSGMTTAGPFHLSAALNATTTSPNTIDNETQMAAAAQLSSAYMFLPNQFHLAAAAAAAAQQQQQQQMQQQAVDTQQQHVAASVTAASAATTSNAEGNAAYLSNAAIIKKEHSPLLDSPVSQGNGTTTAAGSAICTRSSPSVMP